MKILKSIGAVVGGFVAVFILDIAVDFVLESLGIFPSYPAPFDVWWMVLLAIVYRTLFNVVGGYLTATLAPDQPMRHTWVLAGIGFLAAIGGMFAAQGMSPTYYPLALVITAIPSVWLGGWLRVRNLAREPQPA
jgi:hypothetical protein